MSWGRWPCARRLRRRMFFDGCGFELLYWRVITHRAVPERAANFSTISRPWFFTIRRTRLISSRSEGSCRFRSAHHLGRPAEFHGHVEGVTGLGRRRSMRRVASRLPASSILLTEIAAAHFEFQHRVECSLHESMDLFGAVRRCLRTRVEERCSALNSR